MTVTALVPRDAFAAAVFDGQAHAAYLEAKRDLIRQMCLPKDFQGDDALLETVLEIGKLRGLNPIVKQYWVIPRGGKPSIETSIDGLRLIASRTGAYAGSDLPVYDTEDAEYPQRCTITVYRLVQGERCPFSAVVRWSEFGKAQYAARYDNLWKTKPYHMMAIRAESHALKKAFPEETSGLSVEGEGDDAPGGAPEPPLKASGMLPSGLKEEQFARLEVEAGGRGIALSRGMTLGQMAEAIAARGGPRIPGEAKAGDIWAAVKRVPVPPAGHPVSEAARPARAALPPEPPLVAEVREERVEVDPETGEVIPAYVGQGTLTDAGQAN